jgi:acyl-homoserine lactone acylase PvdQ
LEPDEEAVFTNYASGINKVVQNIKTYPLEFHVLFTSFEPWTVKDSVACEYLISAMASTDWFAEMLRLRLLEVYDRELVDQLIPFKPEHTFQFERSAETV